MPDDRFWAKVEKTETCWFWAGCTNASGYGVLHRLGVTRLAHRFAYEGLVGPIPDGMQLDHRCHTAAECAGGLECPHRRCIRPDHLEPVTHAENQWRGNNPAFVVARGDVCKNGHPFDRANTYWSPREGGVARRCRRCIADAQRRYRTRVKAAR